MWNADFTLIAYRGGCGERPENTACAFAEALRVSREIVLDIDVRLTSDDVPVVLHDERLERTTDGMGPIAEHSLGQVQTLDAGCRFAAPAGDYPFRDRGVRVPTLRQLFEEFPEARFNVDIRANDSRHPPRIIEVIEACRAADRVILVSEHDEMIAACRHFRPNWRYGAAMNEVRRLVFANKLRVARLVSTTADVFMIPESHNNMRVLDARLLAELHRRKKKVWIWTINTLADVARLRELGVDGVFTEFPRRIVDGR